jgi:hypothetical protein
MSFFVKERVLLFIVALLVVGGRIDNGTSGVRTGVDVGVDVVEGVGFSCRFEDAALLVVDRFESSGCLGSL